MATHPATPTPTDLPIMGQFTKRPVTVEAYRLPAAGEDVPDSFHEWADRVGFIEFECDRDEGMLISTLEGQMRADPGDWIIKDVKGEFYPCKPEIFAMTYQPAAALSAAASPTCATKSKPSRKDGTTKTCRTRSPPRPRPRQASRKQRHERLSH